MPFINEVYPQFACNQGMPATEQAKWVQNHTDLHVAGVPQVNYTLAGSPIASPDMGSFLKMLPGVLPQGRDAITVAVASHSQFLKKSLLPLCNKSIGFENEMAVKVEFNLAGGALSPSSAACETVFPGAAGPTQFGLCPAEFARCSELVRDTLLVVTNCTCPKPPTHAL